MALPTLDKLNIAQPQPAQAIMQGMEMEGRQKALTLAEKRFGLQEAEHKQNQELQKVQRIASALSASFKGQTAPQQKQIFKSMMPEGDAPEIEFVGPDISIAFSDGRTVSGPQAKVQDLIENIAKSPYLLVGEKRQHTLAWMTANGVSIEQKEPKPERLYETEQGWQPASKAAGLKKPQKSESDPKTAMAWFLKNNPDATEAEVAAFKDKTRANSGITFETAAGDVMKVGYGTAPEPLTKAAESNVQKEIVKIDNSIALTKDVIDSYRGDYQTIGTRWENKWNAFKEKTGVGEKLTKEDKEELGDFSAYRKRAVKNLGIAIHELAGAALSKNEEKMYKGGMPNPGTGLFDGDSPTEFERALVDSYTTLLKAKARHMWYLKAGLTDGDVKKLMQSETQMTLADTMNKIDEYGAQKMQEIITEDPSVTEAGAKETVKQILRAEFGLEF